MIIYTCGSVNNAVFIRYGLPPAGLRLRQCDCVCGVSAVRRVFAGGDPAASAGLYGRPEGGLGGNEPNCHPGP